MSLEALYRKVNEAVEGLDFDRIWPGFAPLHFALYNDDACFSRRTVCGEDRRLLRQHLHFL